MDLFQHTTWMTPLEAEFLIKMKTSNKMEAMQWCVYNRGIKTRVRSHCNYTLVSESLLHFKILLKNLSATSRCLLSKGKWGIKCLKYCFPHCVSLFCWGDVKRRCVVKNQPKLKYKIWQRHSSAWIHLLKMYCAIFHGGTSIDVRSTCKTKQSKLAPPLDISATVMNVHQNQKWMCAMVMSLRGLS